MTASTSTYDPHQDSICAAFGHIIVRPVTISFLFGLDTDKRDANHYNHQRRHAHGDQQGNRSDRLSEQAGRQTAKRNACGGFEMIDSTRGEEVRGEGKSNRHGGVIFLTPVTTPLLEM